MNWAAYAGAVTGSFVIPAAVFWIFFRWARNSEKYRNAKLIAGWSIGLFLIYAGNIPGGKGFPAGANLGDLLAVLLGLFLTYRAIGDRSAARHPG